MSNTYLVTSDRQDRSTADSTPPNLNRSVTRQDEKVTTETRSHACFTAAFRIAGLVFVGATVAIGNGQLPAEESTVPSEVKLTEAEANRLFTLRVQPLLNSKCLGCHGDTADDIKGDYDVTSRKALLAGGESEEASVLPGDPDESPLMWAIKWESMEMPPKENDRLTETEIQYFSDWITAGAPWPSTEVQAEIRHAESQVRENEDGILISTSGGLADEWTYRRYQPNEIWAFVPLADKFQFDSIDGFIGQQIDEANLSAAPMATPAELLRRATFDLTGLPPTPQESKAFNQAWQQDADSAWTGLIDRLLASPHYGERWGQHWLDVVRYADTGGFSNDFERSNAWRYRDYVVRSLNEDKPYNDFVVEQIAGDEAAPGDPEGLISTGFLRMGAWGTAMVPQEEARQLFVDDVVHSVGQSFLSMPMRCCKCHDHKFDPIPTQDYYRMYATFAATQAGEMPAEFLEEENRNGFEANEKMVDALFDYAEVRRAKLVAKREAAAKAWYDERGLEYKPLNARKNDADDAKPERHCGLTEEDQGRLKVREQDVKIWKRRKERFQALAQSVFNGQDLFKNAMKLRQPPKVNANWVPESFIYTGGDYTAKGNPVTPGVLSGTGVSVPGAPSDDPYALPTTQAGRRLAMAKWIVNPDNPLTARSIVNRIWQYHFGQGIVRTANNFGVKGSQPTHVELLDWMARDFMDGGWRMKRLHKLIMTSDAYRRSTQHDDLAAIETVDPDNKLLARFLPRRLTAEEVRDSLLAASGELNRELGGLPCNPEINMEVALQPRMIQFSLAPAYLPSPSRQGRNRRSIYAYRVRGQADPFLEVMNKPNPNDSCEFRDAAAVSPQAFTLLNSDVTSDRSIALATRVQKLSDDSQRQINAAFRLLLGRRATKQETESLTAYIKEMTEYHTQSPAIKVAYPTEITRSLVEEFTGKPFEYTEWLPVFENYESDLKPSDVDAATRAIADMCLLLINTNEFVYVY